MSLVSEEASERQSKIENSLKSAFQKHLVKKEVEVVLFSDVSVQELCEAISSYPVILKPLLALCNIAGRAIERDLKLQVNTYSPKLDREKAMAVSGYIKPFLPMSVELGALIHVDRCEFIDKEIRKWKGRWEKTVIQALTDISGKEFKKRTFTVAGDRYEIDAAFPETGKIKIGIDVKRIEARRDIHKRCDEIERKSRKLKEKNPESLFGVVIYYPFIDERSNVQNRLRSDTVDMVVFAAESKDSIESAVQMLIDGLKV